MVKSREARTLIQDLEETFVSLNEVDLRLNPGKCVFGVPSGKLLGFLVSHRGIKANPEKVKAVEDMSPPKTLREMQKLTRRVTALGRFISRLGERALPFFQLMKTKGPFEWTEEADKAFQDLKKYLTSPPVMVAPRLKSPWCFTSPPLPTPPAQPWWQSERSVESKPGQQPGTRRNWYEEGPQKPP